MKYYVLVTEDNNIEFDSLDELKNHIIPNYKDMSKEELEKYMYEKVFGFSIMNDLQIVETSKGVLGGNYKIEETPINIDRAIIIDDFDKYILSLCKYKVFLLLEEKDHRYFTKDINVQDIDNYIPVNLYASEILFARVGDLK